MRGIALWIRTRQRSALVAAVLLAVASDVRFVHAQARTPEEQATNRRYHQMDAAYGQATGRAPTPAAPLPAPAATPTPVAQGTHRPSCKKHFRIEGTDQILAVDKHFYDFTSEELEGYARHGQYIKGWRETWRNKYARGGYQELPGTHTKKQDCAGYVMDQLWRTGQTFVTAPQFFNEVVAKHGQKISGVTGWGDVKDNDIVVWGGGGHVAIVKKADSESIIIETKDGIEPVYRLDLKKVKLGPLGNDPLVVAYGTPNIYRVDRSRVRITPVSASDCDQTPINAAAQVDRVIVAMNSLPQCPGMQLGATCFQKFTPYKDALTVTASLAREPPTGAERTQVRLIVWTDQATAARDFKSSLDARKATRMSTRSAFESLTGPGQPESGGFEFWPKSEPDGKESGHAFGVFICGNVGGELRMLLASGTTGATGQALIDGTRVQMKGLLQQIGNTLQASGACA